MPSPPLQVTREPSRGTVSHADKVPKLKAIDMGADPDCKSKHSGPVMPDILVVGDNLELANVFVHVKKGAPSQAYAAPKEPVVIDQVGCRYVPHVVGVIAGQELQFRNSDGILHNVHLMPKVNREINIGMPPTLKQKGHTHRPRTRQVATRLGRTLRAVVGPPLAS